MRRDDGSLTGTKKYGWLIGEPEIVNGRTRYWCTCDCGERRLVRMHDLKSGGSRACSAKCSKPYKEPDTDISGQVIGRWIVGDKVGNTAYDCVCMCSTEKVVNKRALQKGLTKSCGCGQSEDFRKAADARVGTRFHNLTIGEHYVKGRIRYFSCTCDCGNVIEVQGPHLKDGNSKIITECKECSKKRRASQRKTYCAKDPKGGTLTIIVAATKKEAKEKLKAKGLRGNVEFIENEKISLIS